ncbi:MAG: hypothetical protein ABL879_00420 [Devosia sp.]
MSTSAAADRNPKLWLLLASWAVTAGIFVVRSITGSANTPLILDTDDAMRLTVVHDFLNGQGWYDPVQHRLNVPYGAEIHWSRLIDLPLAGLLWVLRLFPVNADVALAYVWPLFLLLILLWVCGRLAIRLGGPDTALPAMLLPAFSIITMAEFAPGRLDHHSVQIILGFVLVISVIEALERPRVAMVAGCAAALSVAIAIEGLPMVAAAAVAFGLAWVGARRHAVALRDFGLSFALASLLALAVSLPPERWFLPLYDQISIVYVGAALCCGAAFLALSVLPLERWMARLACGVVAGGLVAGIVLYAWRGLLTGPYGALDPWLQSNWIDRISEAQPWWVSLMGDPTYPIGVLVPVVTAAGVIGWQALRRQGAERGVWLLYGLFLGVALAVMLLQIRAARMATPLAIPACAVLIVSARALYVARPRPLPTVGLLGSWFISASIVVTLAAGLIVMAFPAYDEATTDNFRVSRQQCLQPKAFTELAALPPARLMTPIDLGSHVLLYTPHAVVSAPYHRNAQGVLDTFRFFNQPIDDARGILDARDITLLAICPSMAEVRGMVDYTPDSFVALYAQGKLPPWLQRVPLEDSPIELYRVSR